MTSIAIIGIGEVPAARMPERTHWDIIYDTCIYDTCREAILESGLDKNDIQGVVSVTPLRQPIIDAELSYGLLPEELGLDGVRDAVVINAGGSSTSNALRMAEHWITTGIADAVLVNHVTVHSTLSPQQMIQAFARAGVDMQWEYPYGTTYNIIMGLTANLYMKESGCTPEAMASVVTSLRSRAEKDPNSYYYGRKPPTIEEVLDSGLLNTPLHRKEGNVLADGGSAWRGRRRRPTPTGRGKSS
ncbi:MAG: hypothetical protein AB7S99_12710 [Pseudodonghicola sp.]